MQSFTQFVNEYRLSDISDSPNTGLCGSASLEAFGVCVSDKDRVMKSPEVKRELERAGYQVEPRHDLVMKGYTLGRFVKEFDRGDWILLSPGHVMAYRDGVLTDTSHGRSALRRKLEGIFQIRS